MNLIAKGNKLFVKTTDSNHIQYVALKEFESIMEFQQPHYPKKWPQFRPWPLKLSALNLTELYD